jgi:hypothetical protein
MIFIDIYGVESAAASDMVPMIGAISWLSGSVLTTGPQA